MDLIEGCDLYEAICQNREGFCCITTKRIMLDILNAVKHCHDRGVYLRDIKPENILVDLEGRIYLCDFGLATVEVETPKKNVGTFLYMCPEMYHDPAQTKPCASVVSSCRQDLWSLVIVLFNIRFAAHPWNIASIEEDALFEEFINDPWTLATQFGADSKLIKLMTAVCTDRTITSVDGFIEAMYGMDTFVNTEVKCKSAPSKLRLWMEESDDDSPICSSWQPDTTDMPFGAHSPLTSIGAHQFDTLEPAKNQTTGILLSPNDSKLLSSCRVFKSNLSFGLPSTSKSV
jgi:serine/threonine protein kinase